MQTKRLAFFAAWIAGALLLPTGDLHAKTTAFTGTMKTQLDFSRTYTVDVGEPLQTLTLSIPMPQSGSIFSYAEDAGQSAVSSSIAPASEQDVVDAFGNTLHVIEFDGVPPGTITVHVANTGMTLSTNLAEALPASPMPVAVAGDDAIACLQPTEHVQSSSDSIRVLAQTITAGTTDEAGAARAISRWMLANIAYDAGGATVRTPALTTLANRKARCDGWANLYMALARASGIPARYAAGYWISPQISYTGTAPAVQQVASDHTHAWVELWFPGAGWVPYEPQQTAGFVDTHHLRVWQIPDSGLSVATLKFTADSVTRPNVTMKLISSFAGITDTLALVPAGVTDAADAKSLFTRK